MCRNIRPLFNFDPPATDEEVHLAAVQFVRKLAGFTRPSKANEEAFELATDQISQVARTLIDSLVTEAPPRDRAAFEAKRREASLRRFGARRG